MKPPPDRFTVFVVCDDPSHEKTQAVTNFVRVEPEMEAHRLPGHLWDELYPGRRSTGADSAVTLIDNKRPFEDGSRAVDDEAWERSRAVYELRCRKCQKPYQVRQEKLFGILDKIYAAAHGTAGVFPLPLRKVATMLEVPSGGDTSE